MKEKEKKKLQLIGKMFLNKVFATSITFLQHLFKRLFYSGFTYYQKKRSGRFSSTAFSSNLKPIINQKTLFF